ADFLVEETAPFPIGLTFGPFEPSALTSKHFRYWAIGGQHRAFCVDRPHETYTTWIVGSGTPQGRAPHEIGTFGCQLVTVDVGGAVRVKFQPVDSVRWVPQSLEIAENASVDQLKTALTERALQLVNDNPDETLLVSWQVTATGEYRPQWRRYEQCEEVLHWLRREFCSSGDGGLWSVDFRSDPPTSLPQGWLEEDTILGDYLRAIARYQSDPSLNLALHEYLPPTVHEDKLLAAARIIGADRQSILAAANMTGIEYLAAQREAPAAPR
ncbi:MAG TPA: hypothetical protein PKD54_08820, partial [Pirellulaceae bacterium]|nr:hypothetical protein [Pirellulaceae bacterium]